MSTAARRVTAAGAGSLDGLQQARGLLDRASTAERVAAILRDRILEGALLPGTRLAEDGVGQALGVSRNTLREAFRLLAHERLLVHELNRGVFVRRLTAADLRDIYRLRRLVEGAAVRAAGGLEEAHRARLADAVVRGTAAASEGRWLDVGTANMHFHLALSEVTGIGRLDELMRQALAELRLAFLEMHDPRHFHEPFLARNRQILALLEQGRLAEAEHQLADYLDVAEQQLLARHPAG